MPRASLPVGSWGTIGVTTLANGHSQASCLYGDLDGVSRKVRARGNTAAAARRALLTKLTERVATPRREKHELITFADAAAAWWRAKMDEELSPSTFRRYDDAVRLHLVPKLGKHKLVAMTVPLLENYLQHEKDARAASHVRLVKNVLNQVMGFATRQGAIDRNPVRDVSRVRSKKTEIDILTLGEINRLRAAATERLTIRRKSGGPIPTFPIGLIMDTMIGAGGLRLGEALALRWQDLDLSSATPTASVRGTIIEVTKGDEAWQVGLVRRETSKTASSLRTVAIPDWLAADLRAHPPGDSELVFSTATGQPYSRSNFYRAFKEVQQIAGLSGIKSHAFRKTVGTAVAHDFGVQSASYNLGHSRTDITESTYIKKSRVAPDVRSTLERLGPLMRP